MARGLAPAVGWPLPRSLAADRGWALALCCLVPAGIYYEALLTGGSSLFAPQDYGLTFNSMLAHLLDGRFDVDPSAIGDEGFLRGGATYAYFGILPALLRLPFLPLRRFAGTDFTTLGCLVAVCVMAFFKLLSLLTVWRSISTGAQTRLLALMVLVILAGGAQTQFLRPSIYQEVAFWADACAAAFVWLVLRGYHSERGFTPRLLTGLALAAGLCLLVRVSTAVGLYAAFGLLWCLAAWRRWRGEPQAPRLSLLAPAILLGFAAVAALVNYERWGNPLQFADFQSYLMYLRYFPGSLAVVQQYGEFNPLRLGYGLVYYFFPVWVVPGSDGQLLWAAFQQRTIQAAELPPSSFLVSDPVLVGLTGYAILHLVRHRDIARPAIVGAVLSGLLVPILLMLCAMYMAFRYRIDFYPFLEFGALIGLGRLLAQLSRLRERLVGAGAFAGTCASLLALSLYRQSHFGPGGLALAGTDLLSYYRSVAPVFLLSVTVFAGCAAAVLAGFVRARGRPQ